MEDSKGPPFWAQFRQGEPNALIGAGVGVVLGGIVSAAMMQFWFIQIACAVAVAVGVVIALVGVVRRVRAARTGRR